MIDSSGNKKLEPSYHNWAPYIGLAGRGAEVYNTEYRKVNQTPAASDESGDEESCLNEEFLLELMTDKTVCIPMPHTCTNTGKYLYHKNVKSSSGLVDSVRCIKTLCFKCLLTSDGHYLASWLPS